MEEDASYVQLTPKESENNVFVIQVFTGTTEE